MASQLHEWANSPYFERANPQVTLEILAGENSRVEIAKGGGVSLIQTPT